LVAKVTRISGPAEQDRVDRGQALPQVVLHARAAFHLRPSWWQLASGQKINRLSGPGGGHAVMWAKSIDAFRRFVDTH
jgi:hypothetical protein